MTTLSLPLPQLADQFLVRQDIAFLNHGSFGACPRPVFETYQTWQRELESQPVHFIGRRLPALLKEARDRLATFINAEEDSVIFAPNVTHALNIVVRSLDLKPGDQVLSTEHEYNAVNNTWRFNLEKSGAEYVCQPIPLPMTDADAFVEALWQGVTERTRVIAISHITSPTALIFPVAEVCRRARAEGIITVIDGAHAPGQLDLDMQAIGADFYGGNCHKWMCAPKGVGFLYTRPEWQERLEPLVVSHGWNRPGHKGSGSRYLDLFGWTGTIDPAAPLSVSAAIYFLEENNWPAVRAACHDLASHTRARIHEAFDTEPICPDSTEWFSQMCVASLPDGPIDDLRDRLWDEFGVEIPILTWNDRPMARISVQAYSTPAHMDRLVEGLTQIIGERA